MNVIPMTDDRGRLLVPDAHENEPHPSSVVLTNGLHGSAWQRWHSDGLWHSTSGSRHTWEFMLLHQRGLVLVYEAPDRGSVTSPSPLERMLGAGR